jgi:hypothetical protein
MKAQTVSRGLLILNIGDRLGWVVNATPPGKSPGGHCTGGWVGPRVGVDGCGKEKIAYLQWGSNSEPFNP